MEMSNKSAGTQFEREFAARLAAEGFWVHRFQDNKNGQPCDVIAARNGEAYLFDCKDCKTDAFSLRRVEENQFNAMRLFDTTGNRRGMFAIRYPDQEIYLVDYEIVKIIRNNGKSSIPRHLIGMYGRTLEDWLDDLAVMGDKRTMVVEIGSEIRIRDASKELYDWAQENLIIPNPQYRERERRGLWVGNTPKYLWLYHVDGSDLIVPTGVGKQVRQFLFREG